MNSLLLFGGGVGATGIFWLLLHYGSPAIAKFYAAAKPAFLAWLNSLESKVEPILPDSWEPVFHEKYVQALKQGTGYADSIFNDPKQIRRVMRKIFEMVKNPATIAALLQELKTAILNKTTDLISEELKEITNSVKTEVAVESAEAAASVAIPIKFLKARDIVADVKATVLANKADPNQPAKSFIDPKKEITKDDLERLIQESQARQAQLRK